MSHCVSLHKLFVLIKCDASLLVWHSGFASLLLVSIVARVEGISNFFDKEIVSGGGLPAVLPVRGSFVCLNSGIVIVGVVFVVSKNRRSIEEGSSNGFSFFHANSNLIL